MGLGSTTSGGAGALADRYRPGAVVSGPRRGSGVVLICEHASAEIPAPLGDLGLRPEDRHSHAVWDIGALDVAQAMRDALDAPLVAGATSRLVYDCNRPPEAESAIPARSEVVEVPGNRHLTEEQRAERARSVYAPFSAAVGDVLSHQRARPALVTVHSFTPVWHGVPRATEIGLLHDADDALARAMLAAAPGFTDLRCELNAPYAAKDGVTHTLARFATVAALPSVMIEVRNDLVDTAAKARRVGQQLAEMLWEGLAVIGHTGAGSDRAGAHGQGAERR